MNVRILQLLEGAKEATGLTVIIDVFRAFSVECYLMQNGARLLLPVGDKDEAYALKKEMPQCILIGERGGVKLPGFDFGNSPAEVEKVDFTGKTVVHTTSAGTQGIVNAKNAREILTGSLVNARAIAQYIKNSGARDVSLVCMGLDGKKPTDEDTLCARYIQALLKGESIDLKTEIEKLKLTDGRKFFDPALQHIFPERDFYLSVDADRFNFVLKVIKTPDGRDCIEKIDVI